MSGQAKRLQRILENEVEYEKLNSLSEFEMMDRIKKNPALIGAIKNPSKELLLWVFKKNPHTIKYVDKSFLDEEIIDFAIRKHPYNVRILEEMLSEEQILSCLYKGKNLRYITNPTREMCDKALSSWGDAISFIPNPTEEQKLKAIKRKPSSIKYIENPTEEMIKTAVYLCPTVISKVKQTPELCIYVLDREWSRDMFDRVKDYVKEDKDFIKEYARRVLFNGPLK